MTDHITTNKTYYNQRFGALDQSLNEEENRRWQYIRHTLENLNLPADTKIADFGCGRGWLSAKLSQFGPTTGFDLSEKAIDNASRSYPGQKFICLNAEAPIDQANQARYDLVVSSEVIEHTAAQTDYLKNCTELLADNGYLLLTTPNGLWKNDFYQDGRERWQQPVENWLTPKDLADMVKQVGLVVQHISSFNAEWIFDFQPAAFSLQSHSLVRKLLKLLSLYDARITELNKQQKGLNTLLLARKP